MQENAVKIGEKVQISQNHGFSIEYSEVMVRDFDLNPRALDSSRPVFSNAQGFGSISRIGFLLVSK